MPSLLDALVKRQKFPEPYRPLEAALQTARVLYGFSLEQCEIMVDELVHKGNMKLNMFLVFSEPFKSL